MHELKQLIQQFMPFAQEKMGFNRPPKLFLRQDVENGANPLGKTGFYDPQAESITIYVSNRHPKDILRSLSHELMHHTQKCNGDFDNVEKMGEQGYAQNNPHMRTMEIQAYQASIVFRDWEDSLKETIYYEHLQKGANKTMSTKNWKNRELNGLLMERFGFKFNALDEEEELEEAYGDDEELEEGGAALRQGNEDRLQQRHAHSDRIHEEDEELEEANAWDEFKKGGPFKETPYQKKQKAAKKKKAEEEEIEEGASFTDKQIREVAKRVVTRLKEAQNNNKE